LERQIRFGQMDKGRNPLPKLPKRVDQERRDLFTADVFERTSPAEVLPDRCGMELENQINGQISFKKSVSLSLAQHFPDRSTFSRFRG
jgi:hypothetical protein